MHKVISCKPAAVTLSGLVVWEVVLAKPYVPMPLPCGTPASLAQLVRDMEMVENSYTAYFFTPLVPTAPLESIKMVTLFQPLQGGGIAITRVAILPRLLIL